MNQEIKKNPFNAVDTFNSVKNENPSDYTEAKNRLEAITLINKSSPLLLSKAITKKEGRT